MKYIILTLLLACGSDVSIMKRDDKTQDTSDIVSDTNISPEPAIEPSSEPSDERMGISGYTHLHLKQVACPACVGEVQEIRINFTAEFHQPIFNYNHFRS